MDTFGWRLENLRENSGYSKREISLKLGFSANVYGSYEREERRPTLETIIELADIFNVSLDYLIRGEEYQPDVNFPNEKMMRKVLQHLEMEGVSQPYFLQLDKWEILSEDDFEELNNHFEWVVHRAQARRDQSK